MITFESESNTPVNLHIDRGNEPDYRFGTFEGWGVFEVVRWHSIEELSQPFLYEIILLRKSERGNLNHEVLIGNPASFSVTHQHGHRLIHGVIQSAEEIDRTSKFTLYRVELVPPMIMSKHRGACRTFRKRGFRDVIERLLENRPPGSMAGGLGGIGQVQEGLARTTGFDFSEYAPAGHAYRWSLLEPESSRLMDPEYRSSIIQYNESDFDLMTRLLEEEGLTYYFEHNSAGTVMTITDKPSLSSSYGSPVKHTLHAGASALEHRHEHIRHFKHRHDLRPMSSRVLDQDRFTPFQRLETTTLGSVVSGLGEHAIFASPGGPGHVELFSRYQMERHDAHRSLSSGHGTMRTLEAGLRSVIHDHDSLREDREVLYTKVEVYAQELFPAGTILEDEVFGFHNHLGVAHRFYESKFQSLHVSKNFRPLITKKKPVMAGLHRAVITCEEGGNSNPEINANSNGDVRVRFSWDDRPPEPGTASSKWIPIVNYNSGTGYGSHHTPRVGQTVYTAFHDGDPDQPVILGGFYSNQTPPPFNAAQKPTVSGFRTNTSPGGNGYNGMSFDDSAGNEQFNTNAQTDASHNVGRDSSRTVGGDDSHDIDGDHSQDVGGDSDHSVGNDQSHDIGGDRSAEVGGNDGTTVGGDRSIQVGGDKTMTVTGALSMTAGSISETSKSTLGLFSKGVMTQNSGADRNDTTFSNHLIKAGSIYNEAGDLFQVTAARVRVTGTSEVRLVCGGSSVVLTASGITIQSSGVVTVNGSVVKLNCE